jgi:signal transduction histidine kinase
MKLLRRVLQNFLTNALRYGKGPILLGVRRQGERCGWRCGTAARASPTTSCR